jgi:uracil-DNA glycosylase
MDAIDGIVDSIQKARTSPDLFNHYVRHDPEYEDADAPAKRCRNLTRYLRTFQPGGTMWVGDAPSRFGARWSGVPYTHQHKLAEMQALLALEEPFEAPAHSPGIDDSGTSKAIWSLFSQPMPLLWNAIMVPALKEDGSAKTNGSTQQKDREAFRESLQLVFQTFKPRRVIAIGEKAENAIRAAGHPFVKRVAHPANRTGGARLFVADMAALGISRPK